MDGLKINQGSYSLDDESEALSQAREDAFSKAQSKAQELADLAGLKLGKALSIDESISGGGSIGPIYREMAMMDMAVDEASLQTSIDPGESKYTVSVNVVFELK